MKKNLNILICPLEWGLGHATRMIPVARKLQEMNHNVIIASGEDHLSMFKDEISGLSYISFSGFKPGYSRFLPQYLSLFLKIPLLLYHIILEHNRLKSIIKENSVDILISDNRFGLWHKHTTSVYITHMPLIPFPKYLKFLEPLGVFLHRIIIKKYSFCFIPDLPGDLNLSGRLSHGVKLPDNVRYIGILSKFNTVPPILNENPVQLPHNTIILSGPEPQREILKQKLISLYKESEHHTVMFEGKTEKNGVSVRIGNITFYSHLSSSGMKKIIENSESIIARSGYTSIMELVSLNCSASLIPTPGQTEQEYLADYLSEKGWFFKISQEEIKSGINLNPVKSFWPNSINSQSNSLLTVALIELLEKDHKDC